MLPRSRFTRRSSGGPAVVEDKAMSAREFRDDDVGYLAWLATHADGYVLNIARSQRTTEARVHHAGCRTINGQDPRGSSLTGLYVKVCTEQLAELERWATDHVDTPIPPCRACHPAEPAARPNPTKPTPIRERLAVLLLDLAVTQPTPTPTITVSQTTLASMIGATRENVNRALADLAAEYRPSSALGDRFRIIVARIHRDPRASTPPLGAGWANGPCHCCRRPTTRRLPGRPAAPGPRRGEHASDNARQFAPARGGGA
jgi:Crp-like helix-turn-helix protein